MTKAVSSWASAMRWAMTSEERAQFQARSGAANPDWVGLSFEDVVAQMAHVGRHRDVLRAMQIEHSQEVHEPGLLEAAVFAALYSYPRGFEMPDSASAWPIVSDLIDRARNVAQTLTI